MYIQEDFWESISGLKRASQDRILGALVRLYYLDEKEPTGLNSGENAVFVALRERVIMGRNRSAAGRKGGKQNASKQPSKRQAKRKQTAKQNASKTEICSSRAESESEIEIESNTATAVLQGGGGMEIVGEKDGLARFLAHALKEWNNRFQTAYTAFPGDARRGLAEAFGAGHGPADVDRVLEVVATWEPRFRTPNAAFADGRFEQWLNRPEEKAPAVERPPETAECPECGHERAQITPGSPLYRCEECGITWRAAS